MISIDAFIARTKDATALPFHHQPHHTANILTAFLSQEHPS